jgi:kinesin family protein 1
MESLNLTWEEKMAKTAAIHVEREKALEELGISIDKDVSYQCHIFVQS